jgi:pimeloyl-ACP methyl ester carboxylesterase
MQHVHLNGADLEYAVQGMGDPVLLIHGAILADALLPLLAEPQLASTYRLIAYHRRGFAGSSRAPAPFTIGQQAADGRALLRHLGIPRAHLAGHSYGAAIALQWALEAPEEVQSLALLEPPLFEAIPSGATFWEGVATIRREMYEPGDKAGATDAFLTGVVGAGYREVLRTSYRLEPLSRQSRILIPFSRSNCRPCNSGG